MGLLANKKILITGVLTEASLAFSTARLAQEQGAEVILTGAGRGFSLTQRAARRLPDPPQVLELDVTQQDQLVGLAEELTKKWDRLDGIVHAIGFAPKSCLGSGVLPAPWDDVAQMTHISVYSLKALVESLLPLLEAADGASIVGLDFDATVAWPAYDWMGVAKAGLESLSRYLARDLGPKRIRVNLVAAGPVRTMAAKGIPAFETFESSWNSRAPLGWDALDPQPVAQATVSLLSDWFPMTTGEIIHVDGGFHAVGI